MSNYLPHPGTDALLHLHGNTTEGRSNARTHLTKQIRNRGEELIAEMLRTACRSQRCADGDHARTVDGHRTGCANDGSTCLCECHDPEETA